MRRKAGIVEWMSSDRFRCPSAETVCNYAIVDDRARQDCLSASRVNAVCAVHRSGIIGVLDSFSLIRVHGLPPVWSFNAVGQMDRYLVQVIPVLSMYHDQKVSFFLCFQIHAQSGTLAADKADRNRTSGSEKER